MGGGGYDLYCTVDPKTDPERKTDPACHCPLSIYRKTSQKCIVQRTHYFQQDFLGPYTCSDLLYTVQYTVKKFVEFQIQVIILLTVQENVQLAVFL